MHHRFIQDIRQILTTMAQLPESLDESLEDQIHIFRKSGKRVRALIELFYYGRGREMRDFRRTVAEVARTLSPARDRHVAIRTAKAIQSVPDTLASGLSSGHMLQEFIEAHSASLARDANAIRETFLLACEQIEKLGKQLPAIASKVEANEPPVGFLQTYQGGRRAVRRVLIGPADAERFHDLRKITKQLGYQWDWMQSSERWQSPNMKRACSELGDYLGEGLDLKRLAEQFEEWLTNTHAEGSDAGTQGAELVSEILAAGMSKCCESTNIACRLYFESGKSFGRRLRSSDARK